MVEDVALVAISVDILYMGPKRVILSTLSITYTKGTVSRGGGGVHFSRISVVVRPLPPASLQRRGEARRVVTDQADITCSRGTVGGHL